MSSRRLPKLSTLAILALGLVLCTGCDKKARPTGPRLEAARKIYSQARGFEEVKSFGKAVKYYRTTVARAGLILKDAVPGNPDLEGARKLREDAAKAIARVNERMRLSEAAAAAPAEKAPDNRFLTRNLTPPVLAYVPPEPEKSGDPGDPGKGPADSGTKPGESGTTEPGKKIEPGKKEPEKPRTVKVSRVVLKENSKTVLIYWTFTNLSGQVVRIGAPMGYLNNSTGGKLATFRQHFLAKDFQYNAADPIGSKGTAVTPDSVQLGKGDARAIITVGTFTNQSTAKQAGGARIVVRMSDGSEPEHTFNGIERE